MDAMFLSPPSTLHLIAYYCVGSGVSRLLEMMVYLQAFGMGTVFASSTMQTMLCICLVAGFSFLLIDHIAPALLGILHTWE